MIRKTQPVRESWQEAVESQGLLYHTPNGQTCWDESAYCEFTAKEVDVIEAAAVPLMVSS